jgi:5-formyltetrahydrofolate cyclo-ligase
MDDLATQKKAIRDRILKARAGLCEAERAEKSAAICALIESLDEYKNAGSILFYMTIGGEVDVTPLIRDALKWGKLCALPKCGPGRSLQLFTVASLENDTAPDAMGILEPTGDAVCDCSPEKLDVRVVPGVAFDGSGRRLGRGAGYYDRLLAGAGKNALIIAPAYAFQVLPELPHEPHDAPVDIIVTEEGIMDCRKHGGEHNG